MEIKRLKFEENTVWIKGMTLQQWEIFRDGIMNYGNEEYNALFRFFAGAPGEFHADCVGHTEQDHQSHPLMSFEQTEFLYRKEPEPDVYIEANFWDRFVYPVITQTDDYSDQTREMISEDIKHEGFWEVVDEILAAWKEVKE